MIEIENENMLKKIIESHKNVIVDVYRKDYSVCKNFTLSLEKIELCYPDISFYKLNHSNLLNEELIKTIDNKYVSEIFPCILYYKDGKIIEKLNTSDIRTIENNFILF